LLATLAMGRAAVAGSDNWAFLAQDNSWSNARNWGTGGIFGGAIPGATSGTTNTDTATFGNSDVTTVLPDANRNLEFITFDGSTTAYSIGSTSGNALLMTAGGTIQIGTTFSGSNITETVNAPLTLEGSYTFANNNTNAGVLLDFGGAVTAAATGTQTLTISGAGNSSLGGPIGGGAGTIGLVMNGTGALTLAGNNTFTGGVTINSGIVILGNAGALNSANPNAVTLNNAGTLTLNGQSITIAGLTGGSNSIVQNNSTTAATLTINEASGKADEFDGVLQNFPTSNSLSVTKAGPGSLFLNGTNTFSAGLAIQDGILHVPYLNLRDMPGPLGDSPEVTLGSSGHTGTLEAGSNPSFMTTDMLFFIPTGATGALFANGPGEIDDTMGGPSAAVAVWNATAYAYA
jgi:fibronectin-binding autotransporter adhesin